MIKIVKLTPDTPPSNMEHVQNMPIPQLAGTANTFYCWLVLQWLTYCFTCILFLVCR